MSILTEEEIRTMRKRMGLSVSEFARRVGVHRNLVYVWEAGRVNPTYRVLLRLMELAEQHDGNGAG